ncbi:MAG TPA: sulfatase [Xanthobacteraceae bacterium]|nr:sulfatase [Xanthobacteraceae bacterium]
MHRHSIWIAVLATAIAGSAAAQPAPNPMARPCIAIREACLEAGFVFRGANAGDGLIVDCIRPIMLGGPQPRRATRPLPPIDPQIVAACRARNPNFGFNGPQGQPQGQPFEPPGQAGPPPLTGRPGMRPRPNLPPQAPTAEPPNAPAAPQAPPAAPPNAPQAPEAAPSAPPAAAPSPAAPSEPATPAAPPAAPAAPTETPPAPPATAPNAPPAPPPAATAPPAPQASPPAPAPHSEIKRPNIVFVLTDDLSMNLIRHMPHVLDMRKAGVSFTHYFATDSLCCPSRASIFTGRYPHNTGIFRNAGADGGYQAFRSRGHEGATFASALATVGYRTAMLGKYLNGYQPERDPAAPGWSTWAVAGNGYAEFDYALKEDGRTVRHGNAPQDYLTDVLADRAVQFIKQSAGSPFLVEVATFAPHAPATPAPRDADAFFGLTAPHTVAFDAAPDADTPKWLAAMTALTADDKAAIDRDFRKRAQSVLAVDKLIGDLQAAVAAIGEADNTYFVFSSDNGYHMGEHRLMPGKMTAYDTDIHVPLIVTGPNIRAGSTVEDIAENIDLCPTFAELAGMTPSSEIDGRSLVPLLHGQTLADWRAVALIEHHGPARDTADPDFPGPRSGNPPSYEALRSRSFLYVEYADGDKEYHDLASDPDELHNTFAALPQETKTALSTMLGAVEACRGGTSCRQAEVVDLDRRASR